MIPCDYREDSTHRELYETERDHSPEAPEIGVGEETAEEREEEDGPYEVGHYVSRFGEREVHLVERVGYQVVSDGSDRHDLEKLQP